MVHHHGTKSWKEIIYSSLWLLLGAFIAAYGLEVFLVPNKIIDGGVVGISILLGNVIGKQFVYPAVVILNIPFVILAYRHVGKALVIQMLISVIAFSCFGHWMADSTYTLFRPYAGELLEIVVIGGLCLGLGIGLIIRCGGCLDGTEILGILINKKSGITVGNVVMALNSVIFFVAGLLFNDWQPAIQSLITFFIVIKIMDMVIVGLDEMKSVMIFTSNTDEISEALMHEMGLGLTLLNARGGYTGENKDVIFLIAERLQLNEMKSIVHSIDSDAFIAIENLHEVSSQNSRSISKKPRT